jgi:hypothetical protein
MRLFAIPQFDRTLQSLATHLGGEILPGDW